MKKFELIMAAVAIMTFGLFIKSNAQNQSAGLYLTYNDYLNNKLSYTMVDGSSNANKINLHEFLDGANVTVSSNGKKQVFAKNELFGYHDSNNNDCRFFNKEVYRIIDTTGFYIYTADKLVQQGKGFKAAKVYYFSKKGNDEILTLTPENIAMAFPGNHMFRLMVDAEFKSGVNIGAYDQVSNNYKIKEIYTASLK